MKTYCIPLALVAAGLLMAGTVRPAHAQDRLHLDPGYVDFDVVEGWFDSEPWLEVNIHGALLKLVAEASRIEDPELADLLLKLKAIKVRGYPLEADRLRDVERRTTELARHLEAQGWETVARVRDRGEHAHVYLKLRDDVIAGMAVMVLEPGSDDGAVFVNIVGEIDPAQIGRIGSRFDIGPLQDATVHRAR